MNTKFELYKSVLDEYNKSLIKYGQLTERKKFIESELVDFKFDVNNFGKLKTLCVEYENVLLAYEYASMEFNIHNNEYQKMLNAFNVICTADWDFDTQSFQTIDVIINDKYDIKTSIKENCTYRMIEHPNTFILTSINGERTKQGIEIEKIYSIEIVNGRLTINGDIEIPVNENVIDVINSNCAGVYVNGLKFSCNKSVTKPQTVLDEIDDMFFKDDK